MTKKLVPPPKTARPKVRVKPGYTRDGRKKVPAPPKTMEEIQAANLAKLEQRHHMTPHLVATLILKYRGLLTGVCRALKVPASTMKRYVRKYPECIEALDHARDAMGDKAEMKLFEQIDAGDVRCILFYLSTVHRHRGYSMKPDGMDATDVGHGPVFVETVNIVGVPSGTFLPKEVAQRDNMVIENTG